MPYIQQDKRSVLDPIIGQVGAEVGGQWAGSLNYLITKLVLLYWQDHDDYNGIATITGVLENAKQEFYRRVASGYEDEKIKINGDVY